MAAFKHIPVILPGDKVSTKGMLRDIIGTFLPLEWSTVDSDTLQMSYQTNFTNPHCTVQRPMPAKGIAAEPVTVFVKFLNNSGSTIDTFKHLTLSKDQEALLCHEYSLSGLGAKVYGSFQLADGTMGRIDEFLDARNLVPEDVEDATIRANVAKAMARFHALEIQLPQRPVSAYYDAIVPALRKYHKSERLKALGQEGGVSVESLVDYDFASRVSIVKDYMQAIGAKAAWCIHDVQFMNTMVKHHPQPNESRVALIDFELVMRNYRGLDIGGHFMQKLFKWFDKDSQIAGCRPYSEEEKRDFCAHYAKEWNRVMENEDTAEQVFLEADYGYLLAVAFDVHNMLWFMDKTGDGDPLSLKGLNKLFEEFVGQYLKLALPEPAQAPGG